MVDRFWIISNERTDRIVYGRQDETRKSNVRRLKPSREMALESIGVRFERNSLREKHGKRTIFC